MMVRVYYHIYAVDGVESIIDEQLSLLQKNFNFNFNLNVGIACTGENKNISNVIKTLNKNITNYTIRDVRIKASEFTTLDSMLDDINLIKNNDFIFYFHTKGASKMYDSNYNCIEDWRKLMMYFNVERVKDVFNIFSRTQYNTFGCLLDSLPSGQFYSGNFWWAKGEYIKTLNLENVKRSRFNAELQFIQKGENWKPYSIYNSNINHYTEPFPKEKYKI